MSTAVAASYILPSSLMAKSDVARLIREVETLDNEFETQKVRDHKDEEHYSIPNMSRGLSDFIEANQVKITDTKDRTTLKEQLRIMKDKAPVVHITFAVDADPEFLQELTAWLRKEVHPQALITVGLQPSLVGGIYMRTPNHVHDFSLRALLAGKRDIIIKEITELVA